MLLLLIPVLIVNQEMVVRLGAVTGVGHARLINERFGRFWGWFSVGDLFLLNFLTIVTEFIGVSLALGYFGVSKYVVGAARGGAAGRDHRQRQLPRLGALDVRVRVREPARDPAVPHGAPGRRRRSPTTSFVPGIAGGANSTSVLLIIAIVGTTVAPWQLFFQQSNIIDKRITPRWINYERLDTWIGAFVVVLGAAALIVRLAPSRSDGTRLLRPLHRRRQRPRAELGHVLGSAAGGVLRARAAQRVADRRRRADAVDQLRVRRRVRDQELAAPQLRRRQALLRDLRGADRRRRPRSC